MLPAIVCFIFNLFQELLYFQSMVSLDYYCNSIVRGVNPTINPHRVNKIAVQPTFYYPHKHLHIPTVLPTRIHFLFQSNKGNVLS